MDFQSAMETFAEAWVAANTKNDQVQSQALALTHKSSSSPSRTSSEPSLPRTPPPAATTPQPQSLTTSGSPPQTTTATSTASSTAAASSTNANNSSTAGANESSSSSGKQQRDSSRERSASIVSVTPAHQPQHQLVVGGDSQRELSAAAAVHRQPYAAHNQHLKQELASSPKQEGFDLSKTSSSTAKSLPVHCVVEVIHSLAETRAGQAVGGGGHPHRDSWRRPHIETDTYVFIPANMPFQDLVGEVLVRLNYSSDLILSARGSIVIRNWKPLATDRVADGPLLTVGDILAELINLATLRIQIFRARPSPASEIRDKLLRLLLLRSHAVLLAAGCPLDEATLSSLCRGGNDISEETQRAFESWLQQQHLGLIPNSLLQPPTTNHHHHHPGLNHHRAQSPQGSSSVAEVVSSASGGPTAGNNSAAGVVSLPPHHPAHPHHHHHHAGLLPFSHKSRMRTSFDPELELPRLQRWFGENQHPSRQQIQHYVNELNALESRRDRKPLHVNNVVYWFKNARAAQKRAENRGVNGYSPPGMSPRNASNVSEDCSDEEEDSRLQSASPSPCAPASPPVGPLSLTTRPEDQAVQQQQQQSQAPSSTSSCVKQEDSVRTAGGGGGVSSGSEDDEVSPGGPTIPGFSLVPSPMFSHSVMYMSHYLSPRGPTGCPTSMLDERRKRNRTFIDPVTEVPRLETWFTHNTHPSHALILKYTEELNRMPYRQKFPRLEPKNVQFWFKNRRAKCKRLKMALFDGESPQPHPYHAD
ncbi:uncharacterized protein LOC106654643 [Trichogramma pretiosum]|uniref:uncharacterized protein LOC106654643 n=1 Tax=Trichogramma pretiosum TaxID=7493 RepID=UPI000C71BF83|nr:uncharacterized protein LOC106654643 [Trichogramma pretiosum]